jgi:prepilin-type N-terminal cleavage/methylation domain-containing protein
MNDTNVSKVVDFGRRLWFSGISPNIEGFTIAGEMPARHSRPPAQSGFTILELLVATTVFSLMVVMMLTMTNSLLGHSARVDENAEIERDVRVFFDLLRRVLAQCRIGLNQNTFRGESNRLYFASSTAHLKTNHVSDVRLIVYQQAGDKILRSVVEPTISNFTTGAWNPYTTNWWNNPALTNASFTEVILEGVIGHSDSNSFQLQTNSLGNTNTDLSKPFFQFVERSTGDFIILQSPTYATLNTNPPAGVFVSFGILGKRALARGNTTNATKDFRYAIEFNLPPIFEP